MLRQSWLLRLRYLFTNHWNYPSQTRPVALQHFRRGCADSSDLQDVSVFVTVEHGLAAHAAGELNWRFHLGVSLAGFKCNGDLRKPSA